MSVTQSIPHRWTFTRLGGFNQVVLHKADDIRYLHQLDPKLWVSLACPTTGLYFDKQTLKYLDRDGDGRIRLPEVIQVTNWVSRVLHNPGLILEPKDTIRLADLNTDDTDGAAIHAAALRLLELLGKADAGEISLADVTNQQNILANARFNGDGIITPSTAEDEALQHVIQIIVANSAMVTDASGQAGVNEAIVNQFYSDVKARLAWLAAAQPGWVPDGVDGQRAAEALSAVRSKIDDYFSRCRAAQYDPRAAEKLNRASGDWSSIAAQDISETCVEMAEFPLAIITPTNELSLVRGLNPAWESRVNMLHDAVIKPVLGDIEILTYEQWNNLKARFDDYQNWLNGEAGQLVSALNSDELQALLDNNSQSAILELIQQDLAVRPLVDAMNKVEELLRYRLHLKTLLNNFVSLPDFFDRDTRAIFEAGVLYLDGRACELTLEVTDAAKHATFGGLSRCYLAYCTCTRKDGTTKEIVAAFTEGPHDFLIVGRNGVFFDRNGQDWDATITKVVENPISVMQAFFSPYKKLIRFIEKQAEKSAQEAESASEAKLQEQSTKALTTDPEQTPPTKPKFDIGVLAALGVAVGGIATALGLMLQALFDLGWLMPVGIFGLALLVSAPSMFIAWLKLRQRSLAPLLDASGWALNTNIRINSFFGSRLTKVAHIPKGSQRIITRHAAPKRRWPAVVAMLILVGIAAAVWWYVTRV